MGQAIPEDRTAEYINDFFVNIGPNLARKVNQPWLYEGTVANESLDEISTTDDEVLKFCKEIDISKSSCITNISSRVLKDSFTIMISTFTYLLNCSFQTGIFPDDWKLANVIPLFKGGTHNNVSNFRPVSLLPLPSKIIEKILHHRLSTFIETNGYLDDKLGGFRKKTIYHKHNSKTNK